jgi:hypothetical protein
VPQKKRRREADGSVKQGPSRLYLHQAIKIFIKFVDKKTLEDSVFLRSLSYGCFSSPFLSA